MQKTYETNNRVKTFFTHLLEVMADGSVWCSSGGVYNHADKTFTKMHLDYPIDQTMQNSIDRDVEKYTGYKVVSL